MLSRFATLSIGVLLANAAGAQSVVDDSAKGVPPGEIKVALGGVAAGMFDPVASQFANVGRPWVQKSDGSVSSEMSGEVKRGFTLCGLVNGKNLYGAYTGFRRFAADSRLGIGYVFGEVDLPDIMTVRLESTSSLDETVRNELIGACREYR